MRKVRIGNDIKVAWSLYHDYEPYIIEGKDIRLFLRNAYGRKEVYGFEVAENKVVWTFEGKTQVYTGKHSLELVIEGEGGMVTTDYCDFVNLAACATYCGEGDESNVITEAVELSSTMDYVIEQTGGGGGSIDLSALEDYTPLSRDFSDDFNNDFAR